MGAPAFAQKHQESGIVCGIGTTMLSDALKEHEGVYGGDA
jgi:hypothetical protein